MRALTWLALVGLTVLSLADGRLGLALGIAGVKALLLGFEFMELRFAARAHAAGYALFVVLLVLVLEFVAWGAPRAEVAPANLPAQGRAGVLPASLAP